MTRRILCSACDKKTIPGAAGGVAFAVVRGVIRPIDPRGKPPDPAVRCLCSNCVAEIRRPLADRMAKAREVVTLALATLEVGP